MGGGAGGAMGALGGAARGLQSGNMGGPQGAQRDPRLMQMMQGMAAGGPPPGAPPSGGGSMPTALGQRGPAPTDMTPRPSMPMPSRFEMGGGGQRPPDPRAELMQRIQQRMRPQPGPPTGM
jgi:hypothetical protein